MIFKQFTTNEIKAAGWLRNQLEIQAKGLSGNLDKMWNSVKESSWIGGNDEGWERVPYWLDGFVPLAYLLDNNDMKARAKNMLTLFLNVSVRTAGSARAKRKSVLAMISGLAL